DRLRLVQPLDQVENDERARRGEGGLPGRVREQETADIPLLPEDPPAVTVVGADAFEDASVAAVLGDDQDRRAAGADRDDRREQERRGVPQLEEVPAAGEGDGKGNPAQQMLDA